VKVNDSNRTFVCLLDLASAFDLLRRDLLLIDMLRMGIPAEAVTLVAKVLRTTSCDTADGIRTYPGVQ
jgi:hypothetical protein